MQYNVQRNSKDIPSLFFCRPVCFQHHHLTFNLLLMCGCRDPKPHWFNTRNVCTKVQFCVRVTCLLCVHISRLSSHAMWGVVVSRAAKVVVGLDVGSHKQRIFTQESIVHVPCKTRSQRCLFCCYLHYVTYVTNVISVMYISLRT